MGSQQHFAAAAKGGRQNGLRPHFSGSQLLMRAFFLSLFIATPLLAQHAYTPDEIADGGRLFQSNCTGCHGTGGDLVPGVALMSGKFRRAKSDDEVAAIIRKGVPGTAMQAFNFTDQEA